MDEAKTLKEDYIIDEVKGVPQWYKLAGDDSNLKNLMHIDIVEY